MGLIGWGESPNVSTARMVSGVSNSFGASSCESKKLESTDEPSVSESRDSPKDLFDEGDVVLTGDDSSSGAISDVILKESDTPIFDELMQLIDGLELMEIRDQDIRDYSKNLIGYDISAIELHEAEFILRHAQRHEEVDYYALVRAVHKVAHKASKLSGSNDGNNVVLNNLESLINLVESEYEADYELRERNVGQE